MRLLLRWSIIAASVVDLPEPVAPATSTRPRFSITRLSSTGGSLQLLERRHRCCARSGSTSAIVPALAEDVDPEVADGAVEVRQVHLELALELARLLLGHQLVGDAAHGFGVHRLASRPARRCR